MFGGIRDAKQKVHNYIVVVVSPLLVIREYHANTVACAGLVEESERS